jgi:hypothetical protein
MISQIFKVTTFWLIVVFIVHHFLERHFSRLTSEFRSQDQQRREELVVAAASGQNERRMQAHLTTVKLRSEQDKELEKAWGDGPAAIAKDFRLNISQMLKALAQGASPKGSKVEVSIDRFTDFVVSIELLAKEPSPVLASVSAQILEFGTPYLQRVSFFADGSLLGELNAAAIAAATIHSPPSKDVISLALVASVVDVQPAVVPAKPAATSEGNSPYDQTMKEWTAGFGTHLGELNHMLAQLNTAVDLKSLKTKSEITPRLKSAGEIAAQIAKGESYFSSCLDTLRSQLENKVDPLVVTITLRDVDAKYGGQVRQIAPLLTELKSYQAAVVLLLEQLDSPASTWTTSARGDIQFSTAAALSAFKVKFGDVKASIERVDAAVRTFKAAVP